MNNRKIGLTIFAVGVLLGMGSRGSAGPGASSCNGGLQITHPVVQQPHVIGAIDEVQLRLTTGSISGPNPSLAVNQIVFHLDCTYSSIIMGGCDSDGDAISYMGDATITSNCMNGGNPVVWTSNHSGGDSPNSVTFTASPAAVIMGQNNLNGCTLRFDIQKTNGSSDSTPEDIEQRASFSGTCSNTLPSTASNTASLSATARPTSVPVAGPFGLFVIAAALAGYGLRRQRA